MRPSSLTNDRHRLTKLGSPSHRMFTVAQHIQSTGRLSLPIEIEVDSGDHEVWRAYFGKPPSATAQSRPPYPEPTTLWMLLVGIVTMRCRRRSSVP